MKTIFALAAFGLVAAGVQQPRFNSGVERIVVDVQVVDSQGRPIPALTAGDFEVRLDRGLRKVTSVEFIRAADIALPAGGAPAAKRSAQPAAPADPSPGGRDFIIAIDESSFLTRNAPAAVRAARGFIERLAPNDRVGVFTYPAFRRSFAMTTDHAAVLKDLDGVIGTLDLPQSRLSKSEVIDIVSGDLDVLSRVARRECGPRPGSDCLRRIQGEANAMGMVFESQVHQSMGGLRTLFAALHQDPERKTVVIVSGGLLASDRIGGRPDVSGIITTMGEEAAKANATLYVLHMDSSFLDAFSAASGGTPSTSLMRETSATESGLDRLAGTAGGTLVHVEPGSEERAFQRILRETAAYYLLGVEPLDRDRDGRPHFISVHVKVRGAEVRSRRTVVIPVK